MLARALLLSGSALDALSGLARRGALVGALLAATSARLPAEEDPPLSPAAAAPIPAEVEREAGLAERVRPAVVRIQWRSTGADRAVSERNAVVVDPDGYLLMAGPPPDPAGTLTATLHDGRSMKARSVGSDPETALTLLTVPVGGLPTVTWGEATVPGGTLLMVTGSGAVARGVLRAHARRRAIDRGPGLGEVEVTCLDEAAMAAVAEDLGSPWVDPGGRVAGLLVGAVGAPARDEAAQIGRVDPVAAHAVPARIATLVWPLLRQHRSVPRARLGIRATPASEAVEAQLCPSCGGLVVQAVEPGGPAETAGFERLDLILALAGTPLRRGEALADALLPHRPGDRIRVGLVRRGERVEATVLLAARLEGR